MHTRSTILAALGLLSSILTAFPAAAQDDPPPAVAPADELPAMPDLMVGPTLKTIPIRQTAPAPNETVIDASPLPRDKAPQLDYSGQTSNFKIGQLVTGATSNATGQILADDDGGTAGTLTLSDVQGEFQPGEPLTDESGGAATVERPLREGVWVLNFSYKPIRMRTVEVPGLGRQTILYLYYKVVNRTGKPRMFVPQFFLELDDGTRYPDKVIPSAVEIIQMREAPQHDLLGAVSVTGILPPSTKQGVDDAVLGVAMWVLDSRIARSDSLKVYVRGLSDGVQSVPGSDGGEPTVKYKTLRLDFNRPGDELRSREREIRPMDPAYEWIYD